MTASEEAANLAEPFEGFSPTPYWDPYGRVWTIGYGSTRVDGTGAPVTADTPPIDHATACQWLANEMAQCAQTIRDRVHVPLTQDEMAALEDFVYNLGAGNFDGSTLLRLLNRGDYAGAAAQIDRWDHAGGQVLAGLLRRRQAETALFLTPDASPPAPNPSEGAP